MGISFNGIEVTKVTYGASATIVDKVNENGVLRWGYAPATPSSGTISGGGSSPESSTTDSDSLAVSWSINNENGDDVTGYTIQVSTDANFGDGTIVQTQEVLTSNTSGNLTFDGLASNTTFHFRVKSNGGSGSSSWAIIGSSKTAPAVPTLTAEVWSATAIKLSWTQPPGTDKVYIDQRVSGTSAWSPLVVGSTQSFAVISALSSGTYEYRIIAKNESDSLWSEWSSPPVSATVGSVPTAPAAPTYTISDDDIVLSWTAVTGADEYAIYMYDYANSEYVYLDTATGTSYTHSSVGYGAHHNYVIKAVQNLGGGKVYSDPSSSVIAYSKLATPILAPETETTSTSFRASWNPGSNVHYAGAVYYNLQWYGGDTDSYNAQDNVSIVGSNIHSFLINELDFNTQYTWRVRQYHPTGVYPQSDWLETTHSTIAGALADPEVYYSNRTDEVVRIKWTSVEGATSYSVSGSGVQGASGVDSQGFNYQDISGLTGSTPYTFTVTAVAGAGYSGNSSGSVAFTTLPHNITTPGTNGGHDITTSHFKATWNQPNAQKRNGGIIGPLEGAYFDVVLKNNYTNAVVYTNTVTPSSYPALIQYNYLIQNTSYEVSITAKKAGYTDASPQTFNVSTLQAVLAEPSGIASSVTTNSINLAWNTVPNAHTYTVRYKDDGMVNWSYKTATSDSLLLEDLNPNTRYNIQIRSEANPASTGSNAYATSDFTDSTYVDTAMEQLPTPASNAITLSTDQLYLNFTGETGVEFFGDLRTGSHTGTVVDTFSINTSSTSSSTGATFTGLDSNTAYYLNLRQRKSGFLDSGTGQATYNTAKTPLPTPVLSLISGIDNVTKTTANIAINSTPSFGASFIRFYVFTNSSLSSLHSTQDFNGSVGADSSNPPNTPLDASSHGGQTYYTAGLSGLSAGTTYWVRAQWFGDDSYHNSNISSTFSIVTDQDQVAIPQIPSHNGVDGFLEPGSGIYSNRLRLRYYRPTNLAHTLTVEFSKDLNNFSADLVLTINQNSGTSGALSEVTLDAGNNPPSTYNELAGLDVLVRIKVGNVSGLADSNYTSSRSYAVPLHDPATPSLTSPDYDTIRVPFGEHPTHSQLAIEVSWHYNNSTELGNNIWMARFYPNNIAAGISWQGGSIGVWNSYSGVNATTGLTLGSDYFDIKGALATDNPWSVKTRFCTIQNNGEERKTNFSLSTVTTQQYTPPSITVTNVTSTAVYYQGYLPSNEALWNTYWAANPNGLPGQFRLVIEQDWGSGELAGLMWKRNYVNAAHFGHTDSTSNGFDLNTWLPDINPSTGYFSGSFGSVRGHNIHNKPLRISVVWEGGVVSNGTHVGYIPSNASNGNPPVSNTFSAPSNSSTDTTNLNIGFRPL